MEEGKRNRDIGIVLKRRRGLEGEIYYIGKKFIFYVKFTKNILLKILFILQIYVMIQNIFFYYNEFI